LPCNVVIADKGSAVIESLEILVSFQIGINSGESGRNILKPINESVTFAAISTLHGTSSRLHVGGGSI